MASVKLRNGSKFWVACITVETPEGKRKQSQFSTGLVDRAEALAVAVAAERAARRYQATPQQLRASLETLADEFTPAVSVDPAAWLEAWAKRVAPTVGAATAKSYEDVAQEAADWCRANGVRSFSALTTSRLEALRLYWISLGNGPVTCNSKLKRLSVALEAARREKLLPENPAKDLDRLREPKTKRREFRADELKKLLDTLTGEWKALVLLGIYTGQRLNDLAELTWSQVDLGTGSVTFNTKKTDHLVSLPLMQPALDALTDLPTADKLTAKVFPGIAGMSRQARSNAFAELLAAVGLRVLQSRKEKVGGKHKRRTSELSFHSLRHSATSMLKAAGVSDAIARAIIGHESAAVSRVYTHLDTDTLRAAMEKMPTL